jgi:hypothetical protein
VFIHEIILWIETKIKKLENVTNTLKVILFWIQKKCEELWIIFYDKRVNVCDPRNSRKVENYLLMKYETPFKSWKSMLWFKHANLKKERLS